MEKLINLDLRNMLPFERHEKIFVMLDRLKFGETLRIINDHNPKPLHYQLEAEHKGQFDFEYEKKGPVDWIVKIKKIFEEKNEKKKKEIKELIKQLHSKSDIIELREKGKKLLKNISPIDLALIEQEIIKEGVTRKEMRRLCDVHLEIMKESLEKINLNLKEGHPIHTLMEEHKMILDFINKLNSVVSEIKNEKDIVNNIEMLNHIAEHLVEADKHHQREEDVLFPTLEKFGVIEPPEIMREEHKELKTKKNRLYNLTKNSKKINDSDFIKKIKETAGYLIKELPAHIYKEDNILYPMSIQVIPKNKWQEIKNKCDKIGYCCFTPKC